MISAAAFPFPWLDRAGRLSGLKLVAFLACIGPALYLALAYERDALGAKPITALIHGTGEWTVRFLLASLAVSPLRRIADWPKLINLRRMLGVTVAAYALAHLALYVVDQNFVLTKVVSEIVLRTYLTIGFVALLGLIALGANLDRRRDPADGPELAPAAPPRLHDRGPGAGALLPAIEDRRHRSGVLERLVPAADGLAGDAALQGPGAALDPGPARGRGRAADGGGWRRRGTGSPAAFRPRSF